MSTLKPESDKYAQASAEYKNAYDTYMGSSGLKSATDYAQSTALQNAKQSALANAQSAGNQAQIQARNAGLTKAQSAMLGANAGAGQYANAFGNAYNNLYSQGLQGALGNNQQTANLSQQNLKTAQIEGQNEYDRTWGNVQKGTEAAEKVASSAVEIAQLF